MKINSTDVEYVAQLASLEVPDDEKMQLAEQLSRIVDYVAQLNGADTDDVEPTTQVVATTPRSVREDEEVQRLGSSDAAETGMFKVPKVITER